MSHRSAESTRRLFENTKVPLERAPVLRAIFERFASAGGRAMRALSALQCTFALRSVEAGPLSDLIAPFVDGTGCVFFCPEWEARVVVGLDRSFAFALVEAAFGGEGTEPALAADRPFSLVELRVAKEASCLAASALEPLLAVNGPTRLQFERVEGRLELTALGIDDAPAVAARLTGQLLDREGGMCVIVPQAALLPLRHRLEKEPSSEPITHDAEWSDRLFTQVGMASIRLSAVLGGLMLSVDDVAKFRVGQVLALGALVDDPVPLTCAGDPLFTCRIGKSGGRFTAQIVHRLEQ